MDHGESYDEYRFPAECSVLQEGGGSLTGFCAHGLGGRGVIVRLFS